jgi:hypothetical protein
MTISTPNAKHHCGTLLGSKFIEDKLTWIQEQTKQNENRKRKKKLTILRAY